MLVLDGATAQEQMAIDWRLAQEARPAFRLFRWVRPACSLGFRQPRPEWLETAAFRRAGIEAVERPTGGGLAVHGSDLSCSVVMPIAEIGPAALLAALGEVVVRAAAAWGVGARWVCDVARTTRVTHCLTEPSAYAVMVGGRKLCGFALRRTPSSWLAQGSLLARGLPGAFDEAMPAPLRQAFRTDAVTLEEAATRPVDDECLIKSICENWSNYWSMGDSVAT